MRRLIVLFLLAIYSCCGAFNAATAWDVRTTGNNANGGGYQVGATGTDYSQQDAAQFSYVDILINAATTKATSVARPFSAVDPGNVINITGGAGCTVQRVQMASQAAGLATFDKALGVAGSTCTGELGGSLLTIGVASALMVTGNTTYIQTGTYTLAATVNINNALSLTFTGYQVTHNDNGTKPLITSSTNSIALFTFNGNGGSLIYMNNLSMSHTAAIRGSGVTNAISAIATPTLFLQDCILDGFDYGVYGLQSSSRFIIIWLINTEVKNCTAGGVITYGSIYGNSCNVHDNTGRGIDSTTNGEMRLIRCKVTDNAAAGVAIGAGASGMILDGNTIANNGNDGVHGGSIVGSLEMVDNIFYGNTLYGVYILGITGWQVVRNNAYGANGTAPHYAVVRNGIGDVALVADPFTASASDDYSLNNAAGGGAACRSTGLPGAMGGGTTSYLDIGVAQTVGAAAAPHGSAFVQ